MNPKSCIVFAFAHAGATSSIYQKWIQNVEQQDLNFEFIPLELAGRGRRINEETILDSNELVHSLALSMKETIEQKMDLGAREWITFGHSFGGILSFAVVSYLYRYFGMAPQKIVISGSIPPCSQLKDGREDWSDEEILANILKLGGTPQTVLKNEIFKKQIIRQFRSDYIIRNQLNKLCDETIDVDVSLIHAKNDDFIEEEKLMNWQKHLKGNMDLTYIQGGHFAIYENLPIVMGLLKNIHKGSVPNQTLDLVE